MRNRAFWIGVVAGIAASILFGLFVVPFVGLFDMAATGEPGLLDWWGETNSRRALAWRAPQAEIPAEADPAQGLDHYAATCIHCHGAPEISPAEWAHAMQPPPPELWEPPTQQMSDGELFHVIAHGVKMTGMPAFGPDHSDAELWSIVALVRRLNELADEQRQRLKSHVPQVQHRHDQADHGSHDH